MQALLALSRGIDYVNEKLGVIADWLVLASCLISAGNAFSRYAFSISSNAWLEIQWYMFAGMVLLGASYTLKRNEHVRVDILYANVSTRRHRVFGGSAERGFHPRGGRSPSWTRIISRRQAHDQRRDP